MSIWPKSADFLVHCRSTSTIFDYLGLFKKLKSFALKAKYIKKKKRKKNRDIPKKLTEIDFFDPQNEQNSNVNLAKKCRFLGPLSTYELYFRLVGDEKKIKIVYPNSSTHLKKKKTPDFSKKITEIDFFDPQNGQNSKVNLAKKCRFLYPSSTHELYFWIFCDEKKIKIVPPYSLKEF